MRARPLSMLGPDETDELGALMARGVIPSITDPPDWMVDQGSPFFARFRAPGVVWVVRSEDGQGREEFRDALVQVLKDRLVKEDG